MSIANEIIKIIVYIQANTARAGLGTELRWQLDQSFALEDFIGSAPAPVAWGKGELGEVQTILLQNACQGKAGSEGQGGLALQQVYFRTGFTKMYVLDNYKTSDFSYTENISWCFLIMQTQMPFT